MRMRKFEKVSTALKELFKERVAFEFEWLMQYSHDVGTLPGIVARIIKTMPSAVVQPSSKEEIVSLVKLASNNKIPLIPRGAGSGGYGGAVPVSGGIVVDLRRMNRILSIDREKAEVTVEPGVVWWNLERELNKSKLSLRCYPTSALSATVGGWVAQGGCGVGSFEYGYVNENISSVEVVTPSGELKEFKDDIEVVADCEGITGFITRVTLKVKEHEEVVPVVAHFKDEKSMVKAIRDVRAMQIWSLTFQSPESAKFKNEVEKKSLPEDRYTVLLALHKSGYEKDGEGIKKVIEENGGVLGSEALAKKEWDGRFYPMRFKRLGPTLIPGEVIVPLDGLDGFLGELRKEKGTNTAIEGTMANRDECSVLALSLDDETRVDFPFGWFSPLSVLKSSKKYGGRAYAVGMYLSGEAKHVFGERLKKIKRFKRQVDKNKVMNPGKIFSTRVRSFPLMKFSTLIRIVRPMLGAGRKLFAYDRPDGKELYRTSRKISNLQLNKGDAWEIYSCAQCGYCASCCPIFEEYFDECSTQRGRMFYLKKYFECSKIKLEQQTADKFFLCTTCGKCEEVCQSKMPLMELCEKIRAGLVANGLALEKHKALAKNVIEKQNPYGELKEKRSLPFIESVVSQTKGDVGYFAGCTAEYRMHNLSANSVKIMNALGIKFVYLDADCCCSPLLRTGQREIAEKLILKNIEAINRNGIRTLVTSCAGCFLTISRDWAEVAKRHGARMTFKPKHISVFLYEILSGGSAFLRPLPSPTTVTYHDPCHLGRRCGIYEEPRELLKMIPGVKLVEMEENRSEATCCGAGGGVRAAFPELADALAEKRLMAAKKSGASMLISCCPFCEMSFNIVSKQKDAGIEVLDVVDLVSQSLEAK